jgi:hypothetical protein
MIQSFGMLSMILYEKFDQATPYVGIAAPVMTWPLLSIGIAQHLPNPHFYQLRL